MMRTRWLGRLLVGVDWAEDGKWDFTSDKGDAHSDFLAVSRCRREGYASAVWRICVGPLSLMFALQPKEDRGTEPSMGVRGRNV